MSNFLGNAWHLLFSDRGLAILAIAVGLAGILRAEWLFERLYKREKYVKEAFLREANTVVLSYAAFSRALQAIDLDPMEMSKDGAFALLTGFRIQQILHASFTPEQFLQLRKLTREQMETTAHDYVEQIIASGLGSLKEGLELTHKPKK